MRANSPARIRSRQLRALLQAALQDGGAQPCLAHITTAGRGELEMLASAVEACAHDHTRVVVLLLNEPSSD